MYGLAYFRLRVEIPFFGCLFALGDHGFLHEFTRLQFSGALASFDTLWRRFASHVLASQGPESTYLVGVPPSLCMVPSAPGVCPFPGKSLVYN